MRAHRRAVASLVPGALLAFRLLGEGRGGCRRGPHAPHKDFFVARVNLRSEAEHHRAVDFEHGAHLLRHLGHCARCQPDLKRDCVRLIARRRGLGGGRARGPARVRRLIGLDQVRQVVRVRHVFLLPHCVYCSRHGAVPFEQRLARGADELRQYPMQCRNIRLGDGRLVRERAPHVIRAKGKRGWRGWRAGLTAEEAGGCEE
mmetsp:Transcript_43351/g.139750  ORF Transcript_43351/g.139750 Transcript_43351/m.139750 type:complete len:202 (+) Transcript_43351:345-950(+)